jgi:LytS/YehU family sensor histidine kinase
MGSDGRWQEGHELRLGIRVVPPFWQRWWFGLSAAAAMIALLLFFYKRRIRRIEEREALNTEFNRRLAEMEMTALRAQMNPHFLFNSLNSIKNYIAQNDPRSASRYLTKFSQLMRLILNNSKAPTVKLADELQALQLYIELEALRFPGRFDHQISVAKGINTETLDIPPLILQPYVENAIWHGLMHREAGGLLRVAVSLNNQLLSFDIEDNGIGRAQAAALKSKGLVRHKSHGMQITSDRLRMVNQLTGRQTQVEVFDLKNSDGSAAGTRVRVQVPVG